jgi:hypothetical protein
METAALVFGPIFQQHEEEEQGPLQTVRRQD